MDNDTIFIPKTTVIASVVPTATIDSIETEVMLHGASIDFAHKHGGPLTHLILNNIPYERLKKNKHYVIDTKSVMLMPGMFPAIPGWHCDGVIRNHQFAQPDITKMDANVLHYTATISTHYDGVSYTEFANQELNIPVDNERVWGSVSEWLESHTIESFKMKDGDIIEFNQPTLHRATKAHNKGWRFFFRMSEYHMPPVNKIRHQVQVYTTEQAGW